MGSPMEKGLDRDFSLKRAWIEISLLKGFEYVFPMEEGLEKDFLMQRCSDMYFSMEGF